MKREAIGLQIYQGEFSLEITQSAMFQLDELELWHLYVEANKVKKLVLTEIETRLQG